MDSTALIVWQSYLQTTPADRRSALLRHLSPELLAELEHLPPLPLQELRPLETLEQTLATVHFSWLAPFLRSLPESDIKLFLSCLSQEQIKGLKHALLLSNNLPTLSAIGKAFLSQTLFQVISGDDLLPASRLPEDPLNGLLDLTYEELTSLIDLLSMHDLSIEIRHIIETAKLKEIYALLTKPQTTFLKTLLHKKEPVSFKKMGLAAWKGDKEALRQVLLQRGINRLAKTLYGRNPSLLWHVTHRLDAERGQLLMKLCTSLDHPKASALLADQVVELIGAHKQNNPPQSP